MIISELPRVDLADVLETHNVVGVSSEQDNEYIVVSPKALSEPAVSLQELGSSMPSPYSAWMHQEYNTELMGNRGLRVYDKMRKNDGTVRGTLRLVKTPVLGANWYMDAASDSSSDRKIADFVWKNLTEWSLTSWPQFLTESLLCLDFGHYMFEKVFARGEDVTDDKDAKGKIVWKDLAPRHPMDAKEYFYDNHGRLQEVEFYSNAGAGYTVWNGLISPVALNPQVPVVIPKKKMLIFSFDQEGGNVEGISVLRSAYKHWYYKDNLYKIDAIQKERHGIGIPVITLPVNFTKDDKTLADELGRNLRTNERAHIVLPPGWEISFADLQGNPVDPLISAEHHDHQIQINILAPFLNASVATKPEDQSFFLKGTRFIADVVVDEINKNAIPELVKYNFSRIPNGFPKLKARKIGEQTDWRTMSFAVRNYVGAGIIVPDDELEKAIRDDMALPPADASTSRTAIKTPQMPGNPAGYETQPKLKPGDPGYVSDVPATSPSGQSNTPTPPAPPKVGPPRQAAPSVTAPRSNSGLDKSGGK